MAKNNPNGLAEMVLQLAEKDQHFLGTVRCLSYLRANKINEDIWLRGIDATVALPLLVQQLPAIGSYYIDAQDRLFPINGLTPVRTLVSDSWQAIQQFFPVEAPASAFPGTTDKKHSIQVVPSDKILPSAALLTTWEHWKKYVETAPQIRLDQLQFAVSEQAEVLVIGQPLPPIQGKAYWQQGLLLLPNGYDFDLSNMATFITSTLNKASDGYLLFQEAGTFQKIPLQGFVAARRSAVR